MDLTKQQLNKMYKLHCEIEKVPEISDKDKIKELEDKIKLLEGENKELREKVDGLGERAWGVGDW